MQSPFRGRAQRVEQGRDLLRRLATGLEVERRADIDRESAQPARRARIVRSDAAGEYGAGKFGVLRNLGPVKAAAAAAIGVVEQQPVSTAARQRLRTVQISHEAGSTCFSAVTYPASS